MFTQVYTNGGNGIATERSFITPYPLSQLFVEDTDHRHHAPARETNSPTEQAVAVRSHTFPLFYGWNHGTMGTVLVVANTQLLVELGGFQGRQEH